MRLCLAEKGLAFESKVIDLVKGEHHSPEFLAAWWAAIQARPAFAAARIEAFTG